MIYMQGDDITIRATCLLNGAKENVTGYTFKAAIVKPDLSGLAEGTSIVDATIVTATAGLISATFPRATTASIVPGLYLLEIQAEAGGQRTTYERVEIEIQKALIP